LFVNGAGFWGAEKPIFGIKITEIIKLICSDRACDQIKVLFFLHVISGFWMIVLPKVVLWRYEIFARWSISIRFSTKNYDFNSVRFWWTTCRPNSHHMGWFV